MANSAVINTVYNNYLTSYAPKGTSVYDTHKKSELRSIYNKIIKLNKEAPIFLMDSSKATQAYAVDLKENARILRNTISSVSENAESGLLNKKAVSSSDENVVSAKYIGDNSHADAIASFDIEVRSLASPQVNTGTFLPSNRHALPPDTYSFDIHTGDLDYEFQFNANAGETNRDLQEKIARLINKAGIGLDASVADDITGSSALRITSTATGTAGGSNIIFKISDDNTSKKSGAVDYLGIHSVDKVAGNARFLLNGEERSAYSNHFTIDKTFDVTLLGKSKEGSAATVGVKNDVESFAENISHLITGYNSFLEKAISYTDTQPRSVKLISEVSTAASLYKNELDAIGLNLQEDGTIQIDKALLAQTAKETDSMELFQPVKHLTNMLLRKTNDITIDPMNYVNRKIVAYKNPGKSFVNPYMPSIYSGMMFNSYC